MPINLALAGATDKAKNIALNETIFATEFNEPLIHQVVVAYMAAGRSGSRAQKSRSEVAGSGHKPWKQKGTGRARSGCFRSPIWRGGGVTFAAKPQDHSQKVNKKMYRGAMRSIFAELVRQDRLVLVENFTLASNKTRDLAAKLKALSLDKVLLVVDNIDENLYLAARNLYKIALTDVKGIDPVSLVRFEKVLLTVAALQQIEKTLG